MLFFDNVSLVINFMLRKFIKNLLKINSFVNVKERYPKQKFEFSIND